MIRDHFQRVFKASGDVPSAPDLSHWDRHDIRQHPAFLAAAFVARAAFWALRFCWWTLIILIGGILWGLAMRYGKR